MPVRLSIRSAMLVLLAAPLLTNCSRRVAPSTRLEVSVIGERFSAADPDRGPVAEADRLRLAATAEGLVRLDRRGDVVPGLAERWIVSDDGLSVIFRLRRAEDSAGREIDAPRVARRFAAALAPTSRNPLKPVLGAITGVTAITGPVLEIRLAGPRPNLLQLLGQPELAVRRGADGAGPFTRIDGSADALLLALHPGAPEPGQVRVRAERAGRAIARFSNGGSDLVLGGTVSDWPLTGVATLPADAVRIDPADGLFGLIVRNRDGILADPRVRAALAGAVDRVALVRLFAAAGWAPRTTIVPPGLPDIDAPAALPPVVARPASVAVRALRLALPAGPGGTLIAARLAADWRALGVGVVRVAPGADADLALLDEVAPADNPAWYLRHFTCDRTPACDPAADALLEQAKHAMELVERRRVLLQADQRIAAAVPFVPLAAPLRWSLVRRGVSGFESNRRAVHPLDEMVHAS